MAYSRKKGRGSRNRQNLGYKPPKYPKGYDRWGMPPVVPRNTITTVLLPLEGASEVVAAQADLKVCK